MKKTLVIMFNLILNGTVMSAEPLSLDNTVMNIFELSIKPNKKQEYDEIAKNNIFSSIMHEEGTLAMYSIKSKDDLNVFYMIEIYKDRNSYNQHLDSYQYQKFIKTSPEIIDKKSKIELIPQFFGDKKIEKNERTINNFVIVDVKTEFHNTFKQIVLPEMAESLKIEEGVLAMYAAIDKKNNNRWYFYEVYASESDYHKHRQTPHFKEYIEKTKELITSKESIIIVPHILKNKGILNSIVDKSSL
jgi:quinol monooxygenase YgiN